MGTQPPYLLCLGILSPVGVTAEQPPSILRQHGIQGLTAGRGNGKRDLAEHGESQNRNNTHSTLTPGDP